MKTAIAIVIILAASALVMLVVGNALVWFMDAIGQGIR